MHTSYPIHSPLSKPYMKPHFIQMQGKIKWEVQNGIPKEGAKVSSCTSIPVRGFGRVAIRRGPKTKSMFPIRHSDGITK